MLLRYIFAILIFFLFVGCSPRYVVKSVYITDDKTDKICLKNCLSEKKRCLIDYEDRRKECMKEAYSKAKRIDERLQVEYDKKYSVYLTNMKVYRRNLSIWKRRYTERHNDWLYFKKECEANSSNEYACKRAGELKKSIENLKLKKPKTPKTPVKLSFLDILRTQQKACEFKENCSLLYDNCFINCGGEVVYEKICVENCK